MDNARRAFKSWSKTTFAERARLFLQYADAVEANQKLLITLLVQEQGKPLGGAQNEIGRTIDYMRMFPTMEVKDDVLDDNSERTIIETFPPLGVCCGIVPWNNPVVLCLSKVGPALMTGNTIIVKPSPFTPYCDLKLGELGMNIFPPGVLQVLSGGDDLGPMLTEHPGINKIAFTGSSTTGRLVMRSCAVNLKRLTLELGGNDAAIVCEDVDIDKAAPAVTKLAFMNSGQVCMAIKRLYIHESIYDKFRDAMVKVAKSLKTGDGFEPNVFFGPIQNINQ